MAHKKTGYVPALGWNILTPLYDPLVRLTTREMSFKVASWMKQASMRPLGFWMWDAVRGRCSC